MNFHSDFLLDRARLKKQVFVWRNIGLVLVTALLVMVLYRSKEFDKASAYIARIDIKGIIGYDAHALQRLKAVESDSSIKAVILGINSPGGTVVGGESFYTQIKELAKHKPVICVMYDLATSAAYMVAMASNHLIAHNGTLTGSIGVIMQVAEMTELAKKIGVSFVNFKSGDLKAVPSPVEKIDKKTRQLIDSNIKEIFDYFVGLVKNNRTEVSAENLSLISDGRIFTGKQALRYKMVDQIGNENDAVLWLEKNKNIKGLKIRDYELYDKKGGVLADFMNTYFDKLFYDMFSSNSVVFRF